MESRTMLANESQSRNKGRERTRRMVTLAMLAAVSVALVFFTIPYPLAPFLVYDLADVPVLMAALFFGAGPGLLVLFVAAFIQAMFLGGNGPVGLLMHFLGSGALVLATSFVYRRGKERNWAMITGLLLGVLLRTGLMIPMNFIFVPYLFFNIDIATAASVFTHGGLGAYPEAALAAYQTVKGMLLAAIVPFNLSQAGLNSVICFILFKSLRHYLQKQA